MKEVSSNTATMGRTNRMGRHVTNESVHSQTDAPKW